ncbi:uncharacterized protein SPAPADRAFT_51283 [Spathaspora passalidarum NRRL Y-27907]|uniref:Uncharacterized protein n=1 Tax=Spathaspora passalidarum (strain NRRL Y-27907 / 11-Y1) TaxID=619300 RepID=G3AR81_SPAPN|nr:uncharacterized protein SPAPADRAFT_51283 [Spathaspora passalidarum NRRL Y-27907]EGW31256.1 hypothetical protein SPAPADRAFT_51283 [Spathaspora passalidarum NRRL Y-27907]
MHSERITDAEDSIEDYIHTISHSKALFKPTPLPPAPKISPTQNIIQKHQKRNLDKFWSKWNQIIDKYSQIDPEEGDEISLHTGQITIDNGHLKSLPERGPRRMLNDLIVKDEWSDGISPPKQPRKPRKLKLSTLPPPPPLQFMGPPVEDNLLLNPAPLKRRKEIDEPLANSTFLEGDDFDELSPTKGEVPFYDDNTSPVKKQRTKPKAKPIPKEDDSFEEEYSIIMEPYYFLPTLEAPQKLYPCAIKPCQYITGNKVLYKSHLLKEHAPVLATLGYPVPSHEKLHGKVKVDIDSLQMQCPSRYSIPPWRQPIICGKQVSRESCKMFFLNSKDLLTHQSSCSCSAKKQVLLCPMLGCGYMTDGGYLEWRQHFISSMHCVPKEINRNLIIDVSESTRTTQKPPDPIPELDELFSDNSDWEDIIPSADNEAPKTSTPETSHTNSPKAH